MSSTPDYDQFLSPNFGFIHSVKITNNWEIIEYDFNTTTFYIGSIYSGVSIYQTGSNSFYLSFIGLPIYQTTQVKYEVAIIRVERNSTDIPWFQFSLNR